MSRGALHSGFVSILKEAAGIGSFFWDICGNLWDS